MLLLAAVEEELGDLDGMTVGIGPVVAAARAAAILQEHRPSQVILIGTCGSYAEGPKIGTAIAGQQVGLSYGVAAMGLGYVPRAPSPILCDAQLNNALAIPTVNILTAGAVTTDPTLASRLSDGWTVEHLEAFGVAMACQQADIPFAVVLGVANDVGPSAHAQWLSHREAAQEVARRAVRPLLG